MLKKSEGHEEAPKTLLYSIYVDCETRAGEGDKESARPVRVARLSEGYIYTKDEDKDGTVEKGRSEYRQLEKNKSQGGRKKRQGISATGRNKTSGGRTEARR